MTVANRLAIRARNINISPILWAIFSSLDDVVSAGYDRAKVEAVTAWVRGKDFKHHLPITAN